MIWWAISRPSADDPAQLAVAHRRNALDPVRLKQKRDVGNGSRFGDGDDMGGHDVLDLAAVRFGVVFGELVFADVIVSSRHDRRSVPDSARCKRSPSRTMPIIRFSSSTTATALMPCSTSTLATAGTVAPWSAEITSLVMMSTARIASPQAV